MTGNPLGLSRRLTIVLAAAVGLLAANLYYAQPLVAVIARELGIAPQAAGLVVTLAQVGYGSGIVFAVPLSDRFENKRLVLTMIVIAVTGLLALGFVSNPAAYFTAAFATGFGASTLQVIVPYAAHFAPEERRGATVGTLMSGLMLGIMMSRPTSSLLTAALSWHAVFVLSAALLAMLAIVLAIAMHPRHPEPSHVSYGGLMLSMARLMADTPVLRRRAFCQMFIFGAFCLLWTAVPLVLAGPVFGLSQAGIAAFALVGVSGAVAAPVAGIAADRGWARSATMIALTSGALGFVIAYVAIVHASVLMLALAAMLVDSAVSASLVLGQRAIFALAPQQRGRLNALFVASAFVGGATGSALGAWSYTRSGWGATSACGFIMSAIAVVYFAIAEGRKTVPLPEKDAPSLGCVE